MSLLMSIWISKFWFCVSCVFTSILAVLVFELPNTILWWVVRLIVIMVYWFKIKIQYNRNVMSGVSLFPVITIFNLLTVLTYFSGKYDFYFNVIPYIYGLSIVYLFWYIGKDINEYHDKGYRED